VSEKQFQSQVLQLAKLSGWLTYHTHDSRRSQAGFPDLVLVRPPAIVFAELKTEAGKLRPEQAAWLEAVGGCRTVGARLSPVGWRPPEGGMSFEEWSEEGLVLNALHDAAKWARGDWYTHGEHEWGTTYEQGVEETGLDYGTLAHEKYVSDNVSFWLRNQKLSWSHHRAVAPLAPGIYEAESGSGGASGGATRARLVGFVCPSCFGDGAGDLAVSLRGGAKRLRKLAKALDASTKDRMRKRGGA